MERHANSRRVPKHQCSETNQSTQLRWQKEPPRTDWKSTIEGRSIITPPTTTTDVRSRQVTRSSISRSSSLEHRNTNSNSENQRSNTIHTSSIHRIFSPPQSVRATRCQSKPSPTTIVRHILRRNKILLVPVNTLAISSQADIIITAR